MAKSKSDEKTPDHRCSTSHLLNYISVLMQSDDSLNAFLANPVEACEHHHLTKAERSVLRRVVAHLSNNSTNGYGIIRHLGSYRRSLRLLQNVLHHTGSKLIQDITPVETGTDKYSMIFYTPFIFKTTDATGRNNAFVRGSFSQNTQIYTVFFKAGKNPTIGDLLVAVKEKTWRPPFVGIPVFKDYETVTIKGKEFIKSFKFAQAGLRQIPEYDIIADLSQYTLKDDYVFWFYSINGLASPSTSGGEGVSFEDYELKPGDVVYWQLIAPDSSYGFSPCEAPSKKIKILEAD